MIYMMILRLNKEIYKESCLRDAVDAYGALAEIKVEEQSSYWIVSFLQCCYGERQTVAEFENYLIDRMNSR